jgi:hypothetical protein
MSTRVTPPHSAKSSRKSSIVVLHGMFPTYRRALDPASASIAIVVRVWCLLSCVRGAVAFAARCAAPTSTINRAIDRAGGGARGTGL